MDAAGPDVELDVGAVCVKGVGTTALVVLCPASAGGTEREELVVAEEGDSETGICEPGDCSAVAVVSCSATSSCAPSLTAVSPYFVLLSKQVTPDFFFFEGVVFFTTEPLEDLVDTLVFSLEDLVDALDALAVLVFELARGTLHANSAVDELGTVERGHDVPLAGGVDRGQTALGLIRFVRLIPLDATLDRRVALVGRNHSDFKVLAVVGFDIVAV